MIAVQTPVFHRPAGDLRLLAAGFVRARNRTESSSEVCRDVVGGGGRDEVAADAAAKYSCPPLLSMPISHSVTAIMVIGSGIHRIVFNIRDAFPIPAFILEEAGFMHRLDDGQGGTRLVNDESAFFVADDDIDMRAVIAEGDA